MHTFIIAATSVDGFIAEKTDQTSTDWTSKEDKKFFVERTKQAKVMIMGATTYRTIGRPLAGRLTIVYTRKAEEFAEELKKYDRSVFRVTNLPPAELIASLAQEGFTEAAVCGGASIYGLFLREKVVQTLYLTVEPFLFGQGVKLIPDGIDAHLQLKKIEKLSEQTLLLEYAITSSSHPS